MKKILLLLFLAISVACSSYKKDKAFLSAARGFYSLDNASTTTEVIVNNGGDIYIGGVKTYELKEVKTDTIAVYEHETTQEYYGFSIDGVKLEKSKTGYLIEKNVQFTDLVNFATKKQ